MARKPRHIPSKKQPFALGPHQNPKIAFRDREVSEKRFSEPFLPENKNLIFTRTEARLPSISAGDTMRLVGSGWRLSSEQRLLPGEME